MPALAGTSLASSVGKDITYRKIGMPIATRRHGAEQRSVLYDMDREEKTADEIRTLLQTRIDELDSVHKCEEPVVAPRVVACDPDEGGSNWTVEAYCGPQQYASIVRIIVDALRKHYSLRRE